MRLCFLAAMVALGLMWGSRAHAFDQQAIPYVEDMIEWEDDHASTKKWIGVPTNGNTYTIIGYTRHAGRWRNWACSVACSRFSSTGYRCTTGTDERWTDLGDGVTGIDSVIVGGGINNDVIDVVLYTDTSSSKSVCATDIIDPDDPRDRQPWNRPRLKFMELRGSAGKDVILGPYGSVYSAIIGGAGDDVIEVRSTNSRSFAMGGQYYVASDGTVSVSTTPNEDGNDSITTYRGAVDHLFAGAGEDCLTAYSYGAPQTYNCGSGDDWFVKPPGDVKPDSCEKERLSCWGAGWL